MSDGQARVVLVVDDSSEVREFYQRVLRRAGYRVVLAAEGERALEVVRQIRPDCIVLDVMMPELDGIAFLERLPEEVAKVPPVVVTSGFDWPQVESLARGARFFLHKPLAQADLVACVEAAIGGRTFHEHEHAKLAGAAMQSRADRRTVRDALLSRVSLEDPSLRVPLGEMVSFIAGWFGFGLCAVHVARAGRMHVEAVAGEPQAAHQLGVGASVDQGLTWCAQVVDGGSALLIGDASRNPMLADAPPARAGARFYAGVPVPTQGGLVLGTLCLIDHEPRALHSEDMAVLEQCGQAIGRRLEAMATGVPVGRLIMEAPGLITRHGLHVLLDAHLRAARRQHATIELALVQLGGSVPLESLAEPIYEIAGRRGVAVARFAERTLGILHRGSEPEALRATTDEVLVELARRSSIHGAGVVACEVGDAAILPAAELERLTDEARARATLAGGIERVVLRREPDALHMSS